MLRKRLILSILLVCIFSFGFSQQKWPNTLLWRVTGNGLTKPSYLYGTMHLQDKRLFQFPDSLYQSLEKVEGFALEVDFNDFMDSLFTRVIEDAEDRMLETEEVKVDKKKIDKSSDSILKALDIKIDRMTKKDLKKIRDFKMQKIMNKGEMPTIVDGYLYGIALRLGKWMGGIEDVADQLDLKDELGADLNPDEVFQPEANLMKGIEQMISIYIKKDLQSIEDYYLGGQYSKGYVDKLLINRNIKMARRMDSLSAIRSMFFAVGAAHLPGDQGVINLLRKRGFKVEPVFSPQSTSPESYTAKLDAIPWKKVDDDNLYVVEMPGKPSEYNMFGEAFKMKVFFDLPTMTFYMSGHTIGRISTDQDVDRAFQNMAYRMGNSNGKVKTKKITVGKLTATEGTIEGPEGAYKVRLLQNGNIIYLLMAGSTKKSALENIGINKFFASFEAKDFVADTKKWKDFSIAGKGFSIKLPGEPKPNKAIDKQAAGSNWSFNTYDLVDNEKGLYFLIQIRDLLPGYYLEGDSTYFSAYKNDISPNFDRLISEEQFSLQGWPSFKLELAKDGDRLLYKILGVVRGNRVYTFIIGGDKEADFSEVETVFNSFTLQDYVPSQWKTYSSEGFTTTAPGEIKKIWLDTTVSNTDSVEHFVAYDDHEVISYEVFKRPLSAFYWAKNDSVFYEQQIQNYRSYNDSIIERKQVVNGNLKGVEVLIQKPENNTLQKLRFFVSGDTLYSLTSFIPKQMINNPGAQKFFEDFRVIKELQPTIYTNKSKQLFEALQTKDSATFEKYYDILNAISFTKDDLPDLHQALLNKYYQPEGSYYSVNNKLVYLLQDLADASTVEFISNNYKNLNGEKEELKYDLLRVLASVKTKESYSVLKNLLLNDLPKSGDPAGLAYNITDSIELAQTLFPQILSLSTDSTFTEVLVKVTNELIDSSLLNVKELLPYHSNFLNQAKKNFQTIKSNEENWWQYSDWVPFIGKFNDKETNGILRDFLRLKEMDIKYAAVLALVKNEQLVNAANIETIAADKGYRKDLYEEFKKRGKLKLFPAKYATQVKIAESELFIIASDEDSPSSISFIGERVAEFMGKKQKFYLFKIVYSGEDYSSSYLGVTGPYSLTSKEIITSTDISGSYWEEEYDKSKIEAHFKDYLIQMEKYMREREQPVK